MVINFAQKDIHKSCEYNFVTFQIKTKESCEFKIKSYENIFSKKRKVAGLVGSLIR
jgi:hypothetical protein